MVKNPPANARKVSSICGRSPGEGNDNPLQYPCLGNPMDRGAWRATVHGVTKSQTRLSDQHFFTYSVPCVAVKKTAEEPAFTELKSQRVSNTRANGDKGL